MTGSVVVLSGGVGGAKLALGLYRVLTPMQLSVIVNTGDDFSHYGLPICPDIDTTLYTLANLANSQQGWGREGESWNFFESFATLGGESWFQLGDKDLAVHIMRRYLLEQGMSLSEVTQALAERLAIKAQLTPMSDHRVSTHLLTDEGELPFQHYFVRRQCQPKVREIRFHGVEQAAVSPAAMAVLSSTNLQAIIIAPSNPYLSIAPLLSLPGMRNLLKCANAPVIAVSPVIGGGAVKGPTVKIMTELGVPNTAVEVARHYGDLLDGFVLDSQDAQLAASLAMPTRVTNTLMNNLDDREQLARDVLAFAGELAQ